MCPVSSSIREEFPCASILPAGNAKSIPAAHLPFGNDLYHVHVAIEDTRRKRLQELLDGRYKTKAALAQATGVAPSYISRLLSHGPNRKKLKEDLARKMELEAGLLPFSLDRDDAMAPAAPMPPWPFSFSRARFDRLDPRDRDKIDQAMTIMLSLCEGRRLEPATKKRAA